MATEGAMVRASPGSSIRTTRRAIGFFWLEKVSPVVNATARPPGAIRMSKTGVSEHANGPDQVSRSPSSRKHCPVLTRS